MLKMMTYTYFLFEWTASSLDLDSHGDGGTLVPCLDQGEDVLAIYRRLWWEEVDVFDDHDVVINANASGDEYTDRPGDLG